MLQENRAKRKNMNSFWQWLVKRIYSVPFDLCERMVAAQNKKGKKKQNCLFFRQVIK